MTWLDEEIVSPDLRENVDLLLEEMRLEQQLIAMREQCGLSQQELAERAGVKQPQIARIESGRARNITLRTLAKITSALGAIPQIHIRRKRTAAAYRLAANARLHSYPVARTSNRHGDLNHVEMIAAVLKRHPRRTVRELIALLNKEYRWKTTESAVTRNLYTRRDKFVHTQPDRSRHRPTTWLLK
jgi:transcriptional regulator with XRE-family HTH domain